MKTTKLIKTVQELKKELSVLKSLNDFSTIRSIGLVPTMGALHAGHESLMLKCSSENMISVVSVFVNKTQFNNQTDFDKYPESLEADFTKAKNCHINILFAPDYHEIYPDDYRFKLIEGQFSKILCGAHRPGHFDGVLTVVMRLLQMCEADQAYFGLKDYQQYKLIKDMAESFFIKTKIIGCETIREKSGLAMSSRNLRLSPEGLKKAAFIYQTISQKILPHEAREILTKHGFEVDYLEDHDHRRFVAASLEGVRLIDNVSLN